MLATCHPRGVEAPREELLQRDHLVDEQPLYDSLSYHVERTHFNQCLHVMQQQLYTSAANTESYYTHVNEEHKHLW